MHASETAHDTLADLLQYPGDGRDVEQLALAHIEAFPASAPHLQDLLAVARKMNQGELEELFTSTFDNTAERSLDLGWHIFGENYARGAFMVRMRERLREGGLVETSELPDHVSHVLRVLPRMEADLAPKLVEGVILAAARKILEGFGETKNPYRGTVAALIGLLETWVPAKETVHG